MLLGAQQIEFSTVSSGGMAVSASGFANMTAMLAECQSRIVLALEGGYNLDVISSCAVRCLEVLLGSTEVFDSTHVFLHFEFFLPNNKLCSR